MKHLLPRLALVMLALTAAYGVYEFQATFTPPWVAFVSAAAFELVYISLSVLETPDRRRATMIATTAVAVSVIYNSLAALFTRQPDLLIGTPLWANVALVVLHGAPLAIVAYNLSVLLVHAKTPAEQAETNRIMLEQMEITAGRMRFTVRELAAIAQVSVSELYRRAERRAELTDGDSAVERGGTTFQRDA